MFASLVVEKRAENTALAATLLAMILVTFCSVAILQFENGTEANIQTADDAVWWAFATITTVGYGDRYPTTGEGRLVAVLLMSAGFGLFGTFSAFLAKWFIGEDEESMKEEVLALKREISLLREELKRQSAKPRASIPDSVQ